MTEGLPGLEVDAGRVFCSFHAMPWRATWPSGIAPALMSLLEAMLARDEIVESAGGQIEAAQPLLEAAYPWCCYLARHDPDRLRLVYAAADVEPPSLADRAP